MTRHGKPTELGEDQVESEKGKKFVRDVKASSKGEIYVYQWNTEKSETAPIGLFTEAENIKFICNDLEMAGAVKSTIQHAGQLPHGTKFDLSTTTGFQGSHLEIYNTGRIIAHWPRGGKEKKNYGFVNALLDVVEIMSNAIECNKPDVIQAKSNKNKNKNIF